MKYNVFCVAKIDKIVLTIKNISRLDDYIENNIIIKESNTTKAYYKILYNEIDSLSDIDKGSGKLLPICFYMHSQNSSIFNHLYNISKLIGLEYIGRFDIKMESFNKSSDK